MSHDVIQSLEVIRDRLTEELLNVKAYRAFLAVEQAIAELSEVDEIIRPLEGIRGQVVDRLLNEVREYRALLAINKSIADISDVLAILEESSLENAESTAKKEEDALTTAGETEADENKISISAGAAAGQSVVSGAFEPELTVESPPSAASSITTIPTDVTKQPLEPYQEVAVIIATETYDNVVIPASAAAGQPVVSGTFEPELTVAHPPAAESSIRTSQNDVQPQDDTDSDSKKLELTMLRLSGWLSKTNGTLGSY